jgi:hypothetical protein
MAKGQQTEYALFLIEEICKGLVNLLRYGTDIRVSISDEIESSEILNKYVTLFFIAQNYSHGIVKVFHQAPILCEWQLLLYTMEVKEMKWFSRTGT